MHPTFPSRVLELETVQASRVLTALFVFFCVLCVGALRAMCFCSTISSEK